MIANEQAYNWGTRKSQDKFEVSISSTVTLLPSKGTTGHSPGLWHLEKSLSNIPNMKKVLKNLFEHK